MTETKQQIRKLPVFDILKNSWRYCAENPKTVLLFTLLNYLIMAGCFYTWKSVVLFPLLLVAYVFWSYFFRMYYKRKPYLQLSPIFYSMVPSTKIVVLMMLFLTLLVVLPYAPLFLGFSAEFNDHYTQFLQKYMQDSDWVDLGLSVMLVLVSPWLIYRPFLAWISALIGRSGKLRFAWDKTKGNYFEFLLIAVLFNLLSMLLLQLSQAFSLPIYVLLFLMSPLFLLLNVVMAKIYDFFIIE